MASFTATPSNWTNSSDANFRSWGSYIATRLLAVGHVKTGDTGQIDWATVTAPASANVYQGYEIWRFDDSLQASAPVYIKIEYGSSSAAANPAIRVQFGSGSNGSGSLTGTLSTQYISGCTAVATAVSVVGSGGTARFCMIGGFTTAGGYGMQFGWERSKDAAGNDTVEAVLGMFSGLASAVASTTKFWPVWSTTLGDQGLTTAHAAPALFPPGSTGAFGAQVVVAPVLHYKGIFMNPGLNFLGYYTENIAVNGTPSIYMYGSSHTYYSLPVASAMQTTSWQGPGAGTEALGIRYE